MECCSAEIERGKQFRNGNIPGHEYSGYGSGNG